MRAAARYMFAFVHIMLGQIGRCLLGAEVEHYGKSTGQAINRKNSKKAEPEREGFMQAPQKGESDFVRMAIRAVACCVCVMGL